MAGASGMEKKNVENKEDNGGIWFLSHRQNQAEANIKFRVHSNWNKHGWKNLGREIKLFVLYFGRISYDL